MRRFLPTTAGVVAVLSASAEAQVDYVAINIGPSPDVIYHVDITNPAASPTTPIALLAGDVIRGMELTALKTGWYVATSTLSASPPGFYRLQDGVSTLVALVPFTSTAAGGLAFSANEDCLYWAVDPPTGEDALYRIEFDGTFTLIGPITVPGALAPAILGLATDPLTGVLYGFDLATLTLITIDPSTGAGTTVGPLGFPASGLGGLDFALDGTNRLFLNAGSAVYEVNPATGAGTPQGALPGGTSGSICAVPGKVTLAASPVSIGQNFTSTLADGQPGDLFGMLVSAAAAYLPLAPFGVVRIDLASAVPYAGGTLDGAGGATSFVPVPSDPNLLNADLFFQSYIVSPSTSPPLKVTNHLHRTVQ